MEIEEKREKIGNMPISRNNKQREQTEREIESAFYSVILWFSHYSLIILWFSDQSLHIVSHTTVSAAQLTPNETIILPVILPIIQPIIQRYSHTTEGTLLNAISSLHACISKTWSNLLLLFTHYT